MHEQAYPIWSFSQRCSNRIFSNCLFYKSPAKGWPYRFRSRGTTGSSILDHDSGHSCLGRRIHTSGHSDFGIFHKFVSIIHFWPGCKLILRLLLVPRILPTLLWHPLLLQPSVVMLMILVLWILHKIQNQLLQCDLGIQLGLYISEMLVSTPLFLKWQMSINVAKWTFLLSLCASQNNLRNFHRLWHRNKLVHQMVMCHRSKLCTCNVILMVFGLQRFCS